MPAKDGMLAPNSSDERHKTRKSVRHSIFQAHIHHTTGGHNLQQNNGRHKWFGSSSQKRTKCKMKTKYAQIAEVGQGN